MKIYLIRHSESIDDIEDCYGGMADFDLTENGKRKVELYSEKLKNSDIKKIYTSPYKRAYQTAEILNKKINVPLEIVDNIRELNSYGILSGVNKDLANDIFSYVFKMDKYKKTGYYLGTTFLGGENVKDFDHRVKIAFNNIINKSENMDIVAIITHGGVYRSMYKNIFKIDKKIEQMEDLATTIIQYDGNNFKIIEMSGISLGDKI